MPPSDDHASGPAFSWESQRESKESRSWKCSSLSLFKLFLYLKSLPFAGRIILPHLCCSRQVVVARFNSPLKPAQEIKTISFVHRSWCVWSWRADKLSWKAFFPPIPVWSVKVSWSNKKTASRESCRRRTSANLLNQSKPQDPREGLTGFGEGLTEGINLIEFLYYQNIVFIIQAVRLYLLKELDSDTTERSRQCELTLATAITVDSHPCGVRQVQ